MATRCPGCMKLKNNSPICEHCGFNENVPNYSHQLPVGTVLQGRYQVGKVLGQGGFGITYMGWDQALMTPVAIKEYYPNSFVSRECSLTLNVSCAGDDAAVLFAHNRERFLREAQILAKLSNVPGIVRINNLFSENNTAYITMEYVEGIDLKRYIRMQNRVLTVEEAFSILRPVMYALSKVHEAELVHRDISPDNIMILPDGTAKLLDFGAAREVEHADVYADLPQSTEAILKHGFAPMEQYRRRGSLGPWTDVYALCATLYYCLTGRLPNSAPERIMGDDNVNWRQIPGLNEQQVDILEKGMAILPENRIASMKELWGGLFGQREATASQAPRQASRPRTEDPKPAETITSSKKATDYPTHTVPLEAEEPEPAKQQTKAKPVVMETKPKNKKKPVSMIVAAVLSVVAAAGLLLMKPKEQPQTGVTETTPMATEEKPTPTVTENVTLRVIAAQYTNKTADWWADFVQDFETAYPNIDLVVDVVSWNDIYTVVNTRIANGEAPDILNIDDFADYQADGLLLPVENYLSDETYGKFYQPFLKQSEINGTVWAIPDLASSRALYYNQDILAAAGVKVPTNWEELRSACEALKAYDPSIYPWGVDMTTDEGQACFAYYTLNNGGGFVDENGSWALNSAENVEAIEFIIGMVKNSLTNPQPATQTRFELQELFHEGKVAMMISPNNLPDYCPDINWGVAPIPANNGKASVSLAVMDRFLCFDKDQSSSEMAAITLFYDFFFEDERYTQWVTMEGFLPATATGGKLLAQADPAYAAWTQILSTAAFYPSTKTNWVDAKMGVIDTQQRALMGGNIRQLLDALQSSVAE